MQQADSNTGKDGKSPEKGRSFKDSLKRILALMIGDEAARDLLELGFDTCAFTDRLSARSSTMVVRLRGPLVLEGLSQSGMREGIIMDDKSALVGPSTLMNINGQCLPPGVYERSEAGTWQRLQGQEAAERQAHLLNEYQKMSLGRGRGAQHKFPEDRGVGFCHLTRQEGEMTSAGPDGTVRVASKEMFQVPLAPKNPGTGLRPLAPKNPGTGPRPYLRWRLSHAD